MIGSLVLHTVRVPLGKGLTLKALSVKTARYLSKVPNSVDPEKLVNMPSMNDRSSTIGGVLELRLQRCYLHEPLGSSPHFKVGWDLRVCGSATVLFRKLSLSCVCRKVISNSTSVMITARSIHEENATADRFRRLFHWQQNLPALHYVGFNAA